MVAQVRNHQETRRACGQSGPDVRVQLINSVELQELHAGPREELISGDERQDLIDDAVGSLIPVADWILDQALVAVEERVIGAPRVHANRLEVYAAGGRRLGCVSKPHAKTLQQASDVPAQVSLRPPRFVNEAVYLFHDGVLGSDAADKDPAAAGAEVDGHVESVTHGRLPVWRSRADAGADVKDFAKIARRRAVVFVRRHELLHRLPPALTDRRGRDGIPSFLAVDLRVGEEVVGGWIEKNRVA